LFIVFVVSLLTVVVSIMWSGGASA